MNAVEIEQAISDLALQRLDAVEFPFAFLAACGNMDATFAEFYDLEAMPGNLRRAHKHNDELLERSYICRRFKNDSERLEKLFGPCMKMTAAAKALIIAPAKKAARRASA